MTSALPSSSPRSPRFRRGSLTAVLAGALLAGSAAAATSAAGPASANPVPDLNAYVNLITLQTGATNAFTYYPPTREGVRETERLAPRGSSNCTVVSTGNDVVDLVGLPKPAGLRDGSIGVTDKTSGESCGQVNTSASESLTINLRGKKSSLAVLDIELQKDAVVLATLDDGVATTPAVYVELQSGGNISPTDTPKSGLDAAVESCAVGTSSGPNANVTDNCRWVISGTIFDRITLTAIAGQFSLEGGADGIVANRTAEEPAGFPANLSYFSLVTLCADTNLTVTIGGTTQAGDGSSYTRYGFNADGSLCLALPTTLTRDTAGDLELAKPLGQPFEQGVVTAEWLADPGTPATNKTEVNFWADKRTTGWVPITWCPATLLNTNGTVKWIAGIDPATAVAQLNALGLFDQDQRPSVTPVIADNNLYQYACVLSRSTSYVGAKFETVERIYLLGDIFIRR